MYIFSALCVGILLQVVILVELKSKKVEKTEYKVAPFVDFNTISAYSGEMTPRTQATIIKLTPKDEVAEALKEVNDGE